MNALAERPSSVRMGRPPGTFLFATTGIDASGNPGANLSCCTSSCADTLSVFPSYVESEVIPVSRYTDRERLYIARSLLNRDAVKIGISTNPEARMKSLYAELLAVMDVPNGRDARQVERDLHTWFEQYRIVGEWFLRPAIKEWLDVFFYKSMPGSGLDRFTFSKSLYDYYEDGVLPGFDDPKDDL